MPCTVRPAANCSTSRTMVIRRQRFFGALRLNPPDARAGGRYGPFRTCTPSRLPCARTFRAAVDRALRHGSLARLHVYQVGRIGLAVVGEVADADAEQPVFACRPSPCAAGASPVWKMRSASRVGSPSWRLRVRSLKSCVFNFSTTVRPAMPDFFSRADTFSDSARSTGTRSPSDARSVSKVVSADTLLASRSDEPCARPARAKDR